MATVYQVKGTIRNRNGAVLSLTAHLSANNPVEAILTVTEGWISVDADGSYIIQVSAAPLA